MKKGIVLSFLLVSCAVLAQKTKVITGSFENLKGISEYNVVFNYEDVSVDYHESEEAFISYTSERLKSQKGSANADEVFVQRWKDDKQKYYEPKFIESFNKRFDDKIKAGKDLGASKYTITVKTTFLHPGCVSCGQFKNSSKINAVITVAETANPGNVLLVYNFEMQRLDNNSIDVSSIDFWTAGKRIGENYSKLAKEFASDLKTVL